MKRLIRNMVSNLLHLAPRDIRYEVCRHHANKEFAENRSDIESNGELWLIHQVLPHMNTVFDVGAHAGGWSSQALQVHPTIELHCFEPCRGSFDKLQAQGLGKNVTCNHFGLGSADSELTLYELEGSGEANSLYPRDGLGGWDGFESQKKTEKVHIGTLDGYCEDKAIDMVDFLKIDVEGHELAVIEGGKRLFEKEGIKIVQFEYGACYIHSRVLLRYFYDFFDGMNYSFFLLYPQSLRPVNRYDQRLENFQYKNFLIVNHGVIEGTDYFKKLVT